MVNAAEIRDLHKYYDLGAVVVKALRGVTAEFPKGDFVAIMGASGSGKSTLLNILGALDRPTGGQYILGGEDTSTLSDDDLSAIRNEMIGFIFQSYNLIPQFTVLENIAVPLQYQRRKGGVGTSGSFAAGSSRGKDRVVLERGGCGRGGEARAFSGIACPGSCSRGGAAIDEVCEDVRCGPR